MLPIAALLAVVLALPVAAPAVPAPPAPAVSALATKGSARAPGWGWPLAGSPPVTRAFDPPAAPWLPGHRGVDLAGTSGAAVLSAGAGVVAFAGMVAGRGVVSVDHAGGLRTTYEPVTPIVHSGDSVTLGASLGALDPGHSGCPVAACLHWGLRRGLTYLDPLLLLRPFRVRLKPMTLGRRPTDHREPAVLALHALRGEESMATLMIRDLDEGVKARLRVRAARNGRSMEAEARAILGAALAEAITSRGLGTWIREHFADLDGVPVETPPRTDRPRAADFGPVEP